MAFPEQGVSYFVQIALDMLAISATSSEPERIFSGAKRSITDD